MGIDGLGSTYGVPAIKKEQEPVMDKRKKQDKKQDGKKKKGKKDNYIHEGKIDIRI